MTPQAWVLTACIVLAIVLTVAGVLRAVLSALRVKRHVAAVSEAPFLGYAEEAQAYALRLNADLEEMAPLLARAKKALDSINDAVAEMRMPQAVFALRTASAALRLLFSGR